MANNLNDYKFGEVYLGEIPKEKIPEFAAICGEESEILTKLLEYCWNNGICTYACCKGHKDMGPPYIGFLPDEVLLGYLCEISNQFPNNGVEVDRFEGNLRTSINLISEHDFKKIYSFIKEYVKFRDQGFMYKFQYPETKKIIDTILSDDTDTLVVQIRDGQALYKQRWYDEDRNVNSLKEISNARLCPNYSITTVLHSRLARTFEKSFSSPEESTSIKV